VDWRLLNKNGGDLGEFVGICGDVSGSYRHLWVPSDIYVYMLASIRVGGNLPNNIKIEILQEISTKDEREL